jgi:prevent-host-death family protein
VKYISIRDLRNRASEVWNDLAKEKDLVLTSNGRPMAILSSIEPDNVDEALAALRRARAVLAVKNLQTQSVAQGTDKLTDDEIEAEIAAVRRSLRKC